MHIERILQIGVAALVALSTLLLGMGEQSVTLTLAAIIISFSSVYVTDVKGWIRLPHRLADLLGLGSRRWQFFNGKATFRTRACFGLLSFVIYGQFVLQLKAKGISTYWLLIALSLMETAVSTALNESLFFGVLLLAYVVLAIGVLTIFYLFREQSRALVRTAGAQQAESAAATNVAPASRMTPATAVHGQRPAAAGGQSVEPAAGALVGNVG